MTPSFLLQSRHRIRRERRLWLVTSPREADLPAGPNRRGRRLVIATAVLGLAGIVGSWIWAEGAPGRALRALPPERRAALLSHAVANLRDACEPVPPRSLRGFCREQAGLALQFRECTGDCEELARRHLTQPTR